jgi:hypothetical protein
LLIGLLDDSPDQEAGMAQLLPHETECTDVTARRAHQFGVVALAVTGTTFAWVSPEASVGALIILVAAIIMGVGRYWAGADLFRQFTWRVAEPRGWLRPNLVPEAMATRRVARVIGGAVLATAAILAFAGEAVPATALVAILVPMMLLDATASICLLCVARLQFRLLQYRITGR